MSLLKRRWAEAKIQITSWGACLTAFGFVFLAAFARAEDLRAFVADPATGAVSMRVGGTNCWTYVPQSKEGKPYFHPLAVPGTGEALTSFRPPDHLWHLGFWFSWKYINAGNFWEPCSNAVTRVLAQTVTPEEDKSLTIETSLAYLDGGKEIVREKRRVRVTTGLNGDYAIDWDSAFTAQGAEAVFSCTPSKKGKDGNWASGGYAGLMWRFADNPAFDYLFTNAEGEKNVKACGEPSDRMEVVATSKISGAQAKITLRDHPDNPRHPSPWFVRHDVAAQKGRGYFLVGPSMIFHEPFRLAAGATARFRYTVTVERISSSR